MPTVIDSLIIELGLDATKLDEGQRDMVGKLRQLESATQAHIKPVEAGFNQLIGTFKEFQGRLLGIGALIAGGLGLDRLVGDLSKVNAQAGYLAKSLGITTKELTVWQAAGRTMGVSPEDSSSGLATLRQVYAERSLLGTGGLFRLGGSYKGLGAKLNQLGPNASPTDVAMALAEWAQKEEKDPNRARFALQNMGMSQGMTNMIMQGPDKLQKLLKESEKFGVSDKDAKTFEDLLKSFGNLTNEADKLARSIVTELAPALQAFLGWLNKIVAAVQPPESAPHVDATPGFFTDSKAGRLWRRMFGGGSSATPESGGTAAGSGAAAPGGGAPSSSTGQGTTPSAGGPTPGGSAFLSKERLGFADQLKDPGVRSRVAGMAMLEGDKDPTPVVESLANRFGYVNAQRAAKGLPPLSVDQMLSSGFYGPINRGRLPGALSSLNSNPQLAARMNKAIDSVLGGSNTIGGYTDQGLPTDPNGRRQPQMTRGGNVFTDWNGGPGGAAASAAYRANLMAGVASERGVATAGMPSWLPGGSGGAGRLFDQWKGYGLPSSIPPGGPGGNTTTNSNSSQTSIGAMHVTVPQNASPEEYADGIREHLQRNDPVLHSLTGMN